MNLREQQVRMKTRPVVLPLTNERNNAPRSVVIPEPPKVGYQGVSEPQLSMSEVMERYAPNPSSVLEGTANTTSSSSASTARTATKVPPCYPPSKDVAGSLVTRADNGIWQVASRLSDRQFRDRQRVPPSSADQARLRKLSVVAHLSRTLRAFDVDNGEQAWEQRVVALLALAHDNYLRPMHNNLNEQFNARYSLQANETWEIHSVYPRSLESLKPISNDLVQRTQF